MQSRSEGRKGDRRLVITKGQHYKTPAGSGQTWDAPKGQMFVVTSPAALAEIAASMPQPVAPAQSNVDGVVTKVRLLLPFFGSLYYYYYYYYYCYYCYSLSLSLLFSSLF